MQQQWKISLVFVLTIAILFSGCSTNKPGRVAKSSKSELTNMQPLTIAVQNREMALLGESYMLEPESSVEIGFGPRYYAYCFRRDKEKIAAIPEYTLSPSDTQRKKWLALKEFAENTDWFVFLSPTPLSLEESMVRSFIQDIPISTKKKDCLIEPMCWRLYTMEPKESTSWEPKLKASVQVLQPPFSLTLSAEAERRHEGKALSSDRQFQIYPYIDMYLAMLICYKQDKNVKKIFQVYPDSQNLEKKIKSNQVVTINFPPTQAENKDDETIVYFFPSQKPVEIAMVQEWLTTKAKGPGGILFDHEEEVISLAKSDSHEAEAMKTEEKLDKPESPKNESMSKPENTKLDMDKIERQNVPDIDMIQARFPHIRVQLSK